MSNLDHYSSVCDECGRILYDIRRRYYCEYCDEYYHVCNSCKKKIPKCPRCGVRLVRKSEPAITRINYTGYNKGHSHI